MNFDSDKVEEIDAGLLGANNGVVAGIGGGLRLGPSLRLGARGRFSWHEQYKMIFAGGELTYDFEVFPATWYLPVGLRGGYVKLFDVQPNDSTSVVPKKLRDEATDALNQIQGGEFGFFAGIAYRPVRAITVGLSGDIGVTYLSRPAIDISDLSDQEEEDLSSDAETNMTNEQSDAPARGAVLLNVGFHFYDL